MSNRLAQEGSPYLLQHRDNPVDWYPWCVEAFEKARREDKPILLSIGYSTCHWCHVMAHESFEDEETAQLLNEKFVCIKVDREERPDIDAVYMRACQALNGSGGWPLTVFMTAEQTPFFAGTYFPKHDRYGQPGLIELSQKIAQLWETERERLQKLYDYRRSRTSLHTDDKILLSWNAWTMIALARSGHPDEAVRICDFVEANMTDEANRLYLRWRDGKAANAGQLDDYAVYALALLTLYRGTFDVKYLEQAILRAQQMLDFFEDEDGGFYLTAHDAEELIDRPKETYDGAVPSGNSVAAMVLETLARLTGEVKWRRAADRQMRFVAGQAERYPAGYCFALLAVDKALRPGRELVVCAQKVPDELLALRGDDLNILFKSAGNADRLARCAPFTEAYPVPAQGVSAYLCENGACRKSGADLQDLIAK